MATKRTNAILTIIEKLTQMRETSLMQALEETKPFLASVENAAKYDKLIRRLKWMASIDANIQEARAKANFYDSDILFSTIELSKMRVWEEE